MTSHPSDVRRLSCTHDFVQPSLTKLRSLYVLRLSKQKALTKLQSQLTAGLTPKSLLLNHKVYEQRDSDVIKQAKRLFDENIVQYQKLQLQLLINIVEATIACITAEEDTEIATTNTRFQTLHSAALSLIPTGATHDDIKQSLCQQMDYAINSYKDCYIADRVEILSSRAKLDDKNKRRIEAANQADDVMLDVSNTLLIKDLIAKEIKTHLSKNGIRTASKPSTSKKQPKKKQPKTNNVKNTKPLKEQGKGNHTPKGSRAATAKTKPKPRTNSVSNRRNANSK
jgi:hypothetical protein